MWKNYDDLEESLTMQELEETFAQIIEAENRKMEFQAGIAGVELKPKQDSPSKGEENTLKERLRKRKEQKQQESGKGPIEGVGYKVIGG